MSDALLDPYTSFLLQDLPLGQVHGLLLGSIGPRPIALASTVDVDGNVNLAPFSYFNVFSSKPPIVGVAPNRSGRTGLHKHTYHNAKATGELVVNVVTYSIVQQSNLASTEYPEGVDEFAKSGLTPVPSQGVRPPRVAESPIQMECRVRDIVEFGENGGAGSLILAEVIHLHVRRDLLNDQLRINQQAVDLVARMGGEYYCRAHGEALFTVPRPGSASIGVDGLPDAIRTSPVLTGADLAQLALVDHLPDAATLQAWRDTHSRDIELLPDALTRHRRAQRLLASGDIQGAWAVLLA